MPAPVFEARTWEGAALSLGDYAGRKLWLAFFRYASCPLCNLRVRDIVARHDALAASGVAVVGVVQSPAANIARYMAGQKPAFPLVADPRERLYELYGLEARLAA